MKAIARLVWSYFTGTPVLRAFTIAGLVLLAIDFYILMTQANAGEMLWLAVVGLIALFTGSSLMPVTFGRLARSHSIGVMPGGRGKLLASAFITVVLVAIPAGIVAPAGFTSDMISVPELMKNPAAQAYVLQLSAIVFTAAVLFASWMYLAMWFLTSQRNMAGLFKALIVIVVVVFAPANDIKDLTVTIAWNLQQIAVVWIVFGAGFLLWPRFKAARARKKSERFAGLASVLTGRTAGREFDAMLGTSNPWLLVMSLALPLAIAARFVRETPAVWLSFLTILSVVAGAYSGQAGERSRALWLRGGWTRAALFSAVERSVWRHNAHVLGALAVTTIAIGIYAGFASNVLLSGLMLLLLGTLLSTYLGLTITRGLRWLEIVSGVGVMVAFMALSMVIARERTDVVTLIMLEAGLAVFAVVLRFVAQRRWSQMDWMLCRQDRALTIRGA